MRTCRNLLVAFLVIGIAPVLASAETFTATLAGGREVGGGGDPDGTGLATLTLDEATLWYFIWVTSVQTPTTAHIHSGRAGENGAVVVDLSPAFRSVGGGLLAVGSVPVAASTAQAIGSLPSSFYLNVHSDAFPGGAVRGQLLGDGPAPNARTAMLRGGGREVPAPGDPDGLGAGVLVVDGGTVTYYLWAKNISAPTAARLYKGPAGVNGTAVANLAPAFSGSQAVGTVGLDATLAADLLAHPELYYLNIETAEFPAGAIRGQLAPTESVVSFPVLARNPGQGSSLFKSDLRIQGVSELATTVWAEWYPATGAAVAGPAAVTQVAPSPGGEAVVDDAIGALFGANTHGAVRLLSNQPIRAVANTYNDQRAAGSGTFGQFSEGLDVDRAYTSGCLLLGSHRPRADGTDFRTNLGYFVPGPLPATVTFNVKTPGGALVASQTLTFPGFSNEIRTYSDLLTAVPAAQRTQQNFLITYASDRPVFIYSSVVDNRTDDGLQQPSLPCPAALSSAPVQPPNGAILTPAGNVTVAVGQTVSFTASVSDPQGLATSVRWDFGDGVSAPGLSTAHSWTAAGTYTVTLTVSNSAGLSDPTPDTRIVAVTASPNATLTSIQSLVFTPLCSGCHPPNGGGLDLRAGRTFGSAVNVASSEQPNLMRIKPGDPDNSYLVRKLEGGAQISGARMPQGGPFLSAEDIALIKQWILAGASNN